MRSKTWRFVVVLCASATCWAGCGGTEDPLPVPEVKVTLATMCSEMAEVGCYNMFMCCTGEQIEETLGIAISLEPADCRRDLELLCEERFAALFWAATNGSVTVDTMAIGGCLQAMVAGDQCFQHVSSAPWEQACADAWGMGMLPAGASCVYDWQCVAGSFCAPDAKCRSLPTAGQECLGQCSTGLFCNPLSYLCEALRGAGQPCTSSYFCQDGLFCDFDADGNGACAAPRVAGQPCNEGAECASGYCQPGVCAGTLDEECIEDSDCTGHCAMSGDTCYGDYDCDGFCSVSHDWCYDDYDCSGEEVCMPDVCVQQCTGQPVCAERWVVVDTCEVTLELFVDGL